MTSRAARTSSTIGPIQGCVSACAMIQSSCSSSGRAAAPESTVKLTVLHERFEVFHPSPQREQGKSRSITEKSGPGSLAGASGLHGREAGTDTQSEPQAPPSQRGSPPERRRRGAAEASGAGPSRPGARTPRVPSLALRACMKRGPRRTRLPHPHPHRQHHERSARRELHERIGLGGQPLEPRHSGHPGQQRRPHEGFAGEVRA